MKPVLHLPLLLSLQMVALTALPAAAQFPANTEPASTNIVGQDYPRVDSERRVYFRIEAPDAQSIRVFGTDLAKGPDGVWTGTTEPLDPGFHYYQLTIDGVAVADPASESFFGAGDMRSGIEIPEAGVDFYAVKDVPHGEVRSHWYRANSSGEMRQAFVYTPPAYDADPLRRYPVLYLQHGMMEDRRAWSQQGRAGFILDNLIAEGLAEPMIVVMEDGGIAGDLRQMMGGGGPPAGGPGAGPPAGGPPAGGPPAGGPGGGGRPGGPRAGGPGGGGGGPNLNMPFVTQIITDVIPMVDATYRTIADREHRAMAGLSLGGTQTYQITQANLDKFANIGIFSAPFGFPGVETGYNGLLSQPEEFAKQVEVFYISMGSKEGAGTGRSIHEALEEAGVKHVYYEAPGTAHEFQTWRKSLHGFAQLLFRD